MIIDARTAFLDKVAGAHYEENLRPHAPDPERWAPWSELSEGLRAAFRDQLRPVVNQTLIEASEVATMKVTGPSAAAALSALIEVEP